MGIAIDEAQQGDLRQQLFHPGALFFAGALQAKGNVVGHAQMRKQGEILKHQPDLAPLWRDAGDGIANQATIDIDLTTVLHLHPRDHPQGGGFAAA